MASPFICESLGNIYLTTEKNPGSERELEYETPSGNFKMLGIGRTNEVIRRFIEHSDRGSKATVGVNFDYTINCNELNLSDIIVEERLHTILKNFGYFVVPRVSFLDEYGKRSSKTEVFSGLSKIDVKGIVSKGEQLSVDLVKRIVLNITNVDLFKTKLVLYPHQESAYEFIIDRLLHKGYKEVLLNHKPRSGKSFIAYYYMIMQKPKYVLLLTQFPILNGQWKSEFENLRDHNYNIINVKDLRGGKVKLDDSPTLVMISLQDAKGEDENLTDEQMLDALKKSKFSELAKINWDLIIFDEIHKGKETPKTDKLLDKLKYDKLIGLSATPTKNLLRGTFTLDNTHRYTLAEENLYKKQYPEIYTNPNINHYLFNIDDEVKKNMEFFKKEEFFSFAKFLEVDNKKLVNSNDIRLFFNWFFCRGRFSRKSNTSFEIVQRCESILLFVQNNSCQEFLADILKDILGDIYDIYYTNSAINSSSQLLKKIKEEFIPKNGKKVIIIANKQLTTGITLKYCDMVMFMNDWKSIDDYIQASYRCQSPLDGKDTCYTVDFNPSRAYNIFHSYIESNSSYVKYDLNTAIKEYLDCTPIFESFNNVLKNIDFESFKNRVVDESGIENKFFPKTIYRDIDDIMKLKDQILMLGDLEGGNTIPTEIVKMDESQPDAGKNLKPTKKEEREKELRKKDEYEKFVDKLLNNMDYIRDRLPLFCQYTEYKYDNIDSLIEALENESDEILKMFFGDLLI